MLHSKYKWALAFIILWLLYFITLRYFESSLHKINKPFIHKLMPNVLGTDYLLNASSCGDSHKVVMIVTSYVGHVELRSAHRRAYSIELLRKLGIRRVFLLAKIPSHDKSAIIQQSIHDEQNRFDDIVQGNFIEAYKNLTIKHIMGLQWVSTDCPHVNYVIKLDDDMVVNLYNIVNYLQTIQIENRDKFLLGYVMKGMKPIRLKANKWFVSFAEYSKSFYPPFLSGWMYITTPETASHLVSAGQRVPYFWIDDVFITGVLASKIKISLFDFKNDNMFLEYYELLDCCTNDMIDKGIMCEYSVGSNGNHDNMIVKFANAVRNCFIKKCIRRPTDNPLNETCISLKKDVPLREGNSFINYIHL